LVITAAGNDANNDYVSSFIGDDYNDDDFEAETRAYYCNYCNTSLNYNGKEPPTGKYEYLCTECNITYYPANELIKKRNKFETPEGPSKELLTAAVDDDDGTPTISTTPYFAKQKLPKSFELLQKKGFNITSYYEESR
jgi:hypothetical protein